MSNKIDYTKYRKGSKSLHHLPIACCSKCGRKGEHHFSTHPKTGVVTHIYNHKATIVTIMGIAMMEVTDSCIWREDKP